MEITNIIGSTVSSIAGKVLLKVGAFLGSFSKSIITAGDSQSWTHYGFISRPNDADETGSAEAITWRQGNTVHSMATRDLRDHKAIGALSVGDSMLYATVDKEAFAGVICKGDNGQVTIYAPCEIGNDGKATGAHVICVDPAQNAISIVHKDSHSIILKNDGIILASGSGREIVRITNDAIQLCGDISLIGSVNVAGKLNVTDQTIMTTVSAGAVTATHLAGATNLTFAGGIASVDPSTHSGTCSAVAAVATLS